MLNLNSITVRNFLSFGNAATAMRLDDHPLTLILGQNTDANGGMTRNGAGKSSILQAICYALYGTPIAKIKVDNLINNINQKNMVVVLDFEKNGISYRIERGRKPNILRLFINSVEYKAEDNLAQGENAMTQEAIEAIVGMSVTMFRHIVALNTTTDPFLRMKAGDQRNVIEELLGVATISQRADVLKSLIAKSKDALTVAEADIRAKTDSNDRINAAITQTQNQLTSWELTRQSTLARMSADIKALAAVDYEAELEVFNRLDVWEKALAERTAAVAAISAEVPHLQREMNAALTEHNRYSTILQQALANDELVRAERDIERRKSDLTRNGSELARYAGDAAALQIEVDKADDASCSSCGQALAGTDHGAEVRAKVEKRLADALAVVAQLEARNAELSKEIAEAEAGLEAIKTRNSETIADAQAKIAEAQTAIEGPRQKLQDVDAKIKAAEADVGAMYATRPTGTFRTRDEVYQAKGAYDAMLTSIKVEEERVNPYTSQIDTLASTLVQIDLTERDALQEVKDHQEFLYKLLTAKTSFIRKAIIEQNLSYLNARMGMYLDKLGLPHTVNFVSDLTVEITHLGRDFDYEQLSRGEMNRVNMATSWSFRDVWESLNDSVNLLFVDEMLDQGTDGQGSEAALGVLRSMSRDRAKNVFLISHRDDLAARIPRTILVSKTNDFTSIEENTY